MEKHFHIFASSDDPLPLAMFKLSLGWIGVFVGYILEHATQYAGLAAFVWTCLNIYFLLRDRLKGKAKLEKDDVQGNS